MSKPTEFKKSPDQTKAQYIHKCDPGKKPYAKVIPIDAEKTIIECPLCGHSETHHSMQMP